MQLIILDRDGVINVDRPDYVKSIAEFHFIPGAIDAIRRINKMGIKVAVATNQSCIAKGIIDFAQLDAIHEHMHAELAKADARIDKIYIAPDATDSPRRKPNPGMLIEAMQHFDVSPQNTVMIGDALRDLQAAHAAGCHRCLIQTGKGAETLQAGLPEGLRPVLIAANLDEAINQVIWIDG